MFQFLKQTILKRKNTALLTIAVLLLALAGTFSIYFFFIKQSDQAEAWYSDNWLYRKGIPILNSGNEREDYQVAITVDTSTLIGNGKMQSMCQDMRFTSKITGKELPYWIESGCNSATTKIWVNVDKLPYSASSTYPTIDMYYGNPTASKGENGDETFLLFDDFANDLSKWDTVVRAASTTASVTHDQGGNAGVSNNNAVLTANFGVGQTMASIESRDTFTNGVAIEVRKRITSTSGYFKSFSLGADATQCVVGNTGTVFPIWYAPTKASGYLWLDYVNGADASNQLSKVAPLAATTHLVDTIDLPNSASGYNRWQYIYDADGELWWFVDDAYKASATDTDYLSNDKKISIAQGNYFAYIYNFAQNIDWVFVRKYDEQTTEPSMGTAQAEEQGKGAVGYWSFDEGYGSVTYDSAQNNDGTITGATWKNEDECIKGKCLYFDGVSNTVTVPNSVASSTLNFGANDFSMSVWLKMTAGLDGSPVDNYEIIEKENYVQDGWVLRINNANAATAGRLFFRTNWSGGAHEVYTAAGTITSHKWQHITVVKNGGNVLFYVNGVFIPRVDGVSSVNAPVSTSRDVYIGGTGQALEGFMDEVKIYPYARTADEIKKDYLSDKSSIGKSESQTLNDGLVAHYKMDEASWSGVANEVIDSSGAGNHGQAAGAGGISGTTSTAKYGRAGEFDGVDDYVNCGTGSSLARSQDDSFTISSWIRSANWSGPQSVFHHYLDGKNGYGLDFYGGVPRIFFRTDADNQTISSATTLNSATWYLITASWDGKTKTGKIYIDGKLDTVGQMPYTFSSSGGTCYLGSLSTSYIFDGFLDDIHIYNRALSEREVRQLYNEAPPPVLHMKFDEGIGTTAYDSAGSNDGTLTSGPTWKGAGECVRGGCLDFDGVDDDTVVSDNTILDIKGAITMSAWIKPDLINHSGGGTWPRVISKSGAYEMFLNSSSNGILTARFTGLSDTDVNTSNVLPLNEWSYVTATYDQSTGNKIVYINGVEDNREASTTGEISINGTDFYVGDNSAGTRQWDGKIDDVRIYNYARTSKQIAEDMMAGAPATSVGGRTAGGSPTAPSMGPVLYYDFDNIGMASSFDYSNVRGVVYDQSGRGNHGEVYNATSTPGKFGNALGFDGSGDYVSFSGVDISNGLSYSVWFKLGGTPSNWNLLSNKRTLIRIVDSNSFGWFPDVYVGGTLITSSILGNVWHHFVVTQTGTTYSAYLDGVLLGTGTANALGNTVFSQGIGYYNSTANFIGKIDEVKIYPYALSEDEIKVDYNKGKALLVAPTENPTIAASGAHPGGSAPIMHLTFDEKTGTTSTDRTGNGNDAGFGQGTTAPTWKGSGYCKKGGCLEFDGVNDYADVGVKSQLNMGGTFTASVWVKANSLPVACGNVVPMGQTHGGTSGWMFYQCATLVYFVVYDYEDDIVSAGMNLPVGEWTHLVGTSDSTETCIYINGVKKDCDNKGAGSYAHPTTNGLWFGAYGTADDNGKDFWFDGLVDEAKVWDRVLTPAEIAYEYNGGKPVGHWKFDEGDGDWAYDASGNGNHGYVIIGEGGTNAATSTAWQNGESGVFNGSLDFDGTDDYVEKKVVNFQSNDSQGSISAWIKISGTGNQEIFATSDTGTENYFFGFLVEASAGNIRVTQKNNDTLDDVSATTAVNDGNWHHVVLTSDGSSYSMFVDGKEEVLTVGSGSNSGDWFSDTTLRDNFVIGALVRTSITNYIDGLIDDIRVYNYARSPSQIKMDYNNNKALYFK